MSAENLPNGAQIESLIQGYIDGTLSPEEAGRLKSALKHDPSLVGTVLENLQMDALIRSVVSQPDWISSAVELDQQSKIIESSDLSSRTIVDARKWFHRAHLRAWTPRAACIAALVVAIWWFFPQTAEPVLSGNFEGSLEVKRGAEVLRPSAGFKPQPNDFFTLSGTNSASLAYTSERTQIEFMPGSRWKVLPWRRGKQFELLNGKLHAFVAPQPFGKPMILRTSHAEARIIGTRFNLFENANLTRLEVSEGKIALKQLNSAAEVLVSAGHYAVVSANSELAALPLPGSVSREYWTNMPGDSFIHLITNRRYPDQPDGRELLKQLEAPTNWADNYAARIRGFIHPPITGDYTFWIAAEDEASLWLSPDASPENRVQMAMCIQTLAGPREWSVTRRQQSAKVQLVAGRVYYFEILHKAAVGEDHLSVAWQIPGSEREVIDGKYLSPFEEKKGRNGK